MTTAQRVRVMAGAMVLALAGLLPTPASPAGADDKVPLGGGAGIVVNGELVPDTRPLRAHDAGRSMRWAREGVLAPNEVLLVSRWPTSLDSRYFGPVSTDRVIATMKPLWTWH